MDEKRGRVMWDCVWSQIEMIESNLSGDANRRVIAIRRRKAALGALRTQLAKAAA